MSRISKLPQIISKHNQKQIQAPAQQKSQQVSNSSHNDSKITTELIYFLNQGNNANLKNSLKIANLMVPSKSYEKFILRSNRLNQKSSDSLTTATTATSTTTTSGILTDGKTNSSVDYDDVDAYVGDSTTDEACYNDLYSNSSSITIDDALSCTSESELTDITPMSPNRQQIENRLRRANESSTPMKQKQSIGFSAQKVSPLSDIDLVHFASGKTEEIYPNGTKKIKYKNGTVKYVYSNSSSNCSSSSSTCDSATHTNRILSPTQSTCSPSLQQSQTSYSSIFNKYDDALRSTIKFENGDLVDLYESGTEIYFLRQQDLIIEKHVDKREIYRYLDSGLIEIKHPNGFIEMIHTSDLNEFQFAFSGDS